MRIAYLNCFSGDMLLGALVDACVPRTVLEDAVAALDLNASLRFETVDRNGISATKVHVLENGQLAEAAVASEGQTESPRSLHRAAGHTHPHIAEKSPDAGPVEFAQSQPRSLTEIRRLIDDSCLASDVKSLAIKVFELLGQSDAKVHNVPIEEIHFHEVGAVDAIVDIVASAVGILYLNVDSWFSSPINVGGGTVRCAHGIFPVPAPATALLLRGVPTYSARLQKELVTPTGAALLRALEPTFGPQPAMSVDRIGYEAGTRNPIELSNVLRLSMGEAYKNGVEREPPQSSQPVAELFGTKVNRLYDVGVAGLHRLLAVRDQLLEADVVIVYAGMEGGAALGGWRLGCRSSHRGTDIGGLWSVVRRLCGAARNAQLLFAERDGGQHR